MSEREVLRLDTYQDRLFKLLPAEISAAFISIHGVVGNPDPLNLDQDSPRLILASAIALLILNVPYLTMFQQVTSKIQIAYTTGAFVLWALSIESFRSEYYLGILPVYTSVCLILYTLLAPFVVQGRPNGAAPAI